MGICTGFRRNPALSTKYEINNILFQFNRNTKPKWCLLLYSGISGSGSLAVQSMYPSFLRNQRCRKAISEVTANTLGTRAKGAASPWGQSHRGRGLLLPPGHCPRPQSLLRLPPHVPSRPLRSDLGPRASPGSRAPGSEGAEPRRCPCKGPKRVDHLSLGSAAGFLPRAGLGGFEKRFSKSITQTGTVPLRAEQVLHNHQSRGWGTCSRAKGCTLRPAHAHARSGCLGATPRKTWPATHAQFS